MSSTERVLIDATSLRGLSGIRGIGRYVRDLLIGLARVAPEAAPELSLSAITHLRPGDVRKSSDLVAVAEESVAEANTFDGTLFACRRAMLGPVARMSRASLLHIPEMRGTPFPPRVPYVATCHDLIPLVYPETYLDWRVGLPLADREVVLAAPARAYARGRVTRRYRMAERVVCISQRTADDVHGLLNVPTDRLDVVPSGVDLARYQPAEGARVVGQERPFAVYVGYCDPRKNIRRMFEAVREANISAPLDLRWAGDIRGADLEKMQALAHEVGAEKYVHFLGFVDDKALVELYRDAVALLFLSRLEGFGLPVLEAMAAGCPTIVARHSASDEVCGDTGIIVDPDDVKSAAEALVRLARDPDERARRGKAGLERAQQFRCETMARGHLGSYLRALGIPRLSLAASRFLRFHPLRAGVFATVFEMAVPALAALAAVALLSGDEELSYAGLKRRLRTAAHEEPMDTAITTVLTAAVLFYVAERDTNPRVSTLADALEFTSTAMSVGYSNFFPETEAGKLIASALMTAGPSLTAGFLDPPAAELDADARRPSGRERGRDRPAELPLDAPPEALSVTDRLLAEKLDAILAELQAQRPHVADRKEDLPSPPPPRCLPTSSPQSRSCRR